jgi:3-hydroxyisobutyrate dehydrogenase-like beta-hydroxyacid dehydrogenase
VTTAVIGTGGIGSVIARQLASAGETLRLSCADTKSARLTGEVAVVPSSLLGIDPQGNVSRLLPDGQSSGEVATMST